MASLFQILKKGATTPLVESGTSEYNYTTNTTDVTTHHTNIDGVGTWQTNPASAPAIFDIENSSGNTHLATFENEWDDWIPDGEGNTGTSWSLITGPTPTAETGPNHSVTGSYYTYAEVDGATSSTFSLEKTISASDKLACVGFYFFMFGSGMGSLYFEVKIGSTWHTLWSRTGQQHDYTSGILGKNFQLQPYEPVALYMSDFDGVISSPTIVPDDIISIRFRYVSTASAVGDCAIDNVSVSYNPYSD